MCPISEHHLGNAEDEKIKRVFPAETQIEQTTCHSTKPTLSNCSPRFWRSLDAFGSAWRNAIAFSKKKMRTFSSASKKHIGVPRPSSDKHLVLWFLSKATEMTMLGRRILTVSTIALLSVGMAEASQAIQYGTADEAKAMLSRAVGPWGRKPLIG
jgi:hypothetical protein